MGPPTLNREGLTEQSISPLTIHAKPDTQNEAHPSHTKITGTSIPALLKYCLDVCLGNVNVDNPLPVEDAGDRNEFFLENTVVSTGLVQTVITYTVLAPDTLRLNNVLASSSQQIVCKVYKNGTLIGTTRSGAANKQATFKWEPNRTLIVGDVLLITAQAITGGPLFGDDIDVFFQGRKY